MNLYDPKDIFFGKTQHNSMLKKTDDSKVVVWPGYCLFWLKISQVKI